MAEKCLQLIRSFDKLTFFYLIAGSRTKLNKMLTVTQSQKDVMGRFQNALFSGNIVERIKVLAETEQGKYYNAHELQ